MPHDLHDATHPCRWSGGRPDFSLLSAQMDRLLAAMVAELEPTLAALEEAQRRLFAHRRYSVLLILQGLDASGKDSLIRTLNQAMDPVGFRVWSFGRPTPEEQRHDFLWRIHRCLPARGEIAAFNRSHYEAVMAERLLPDAPSEESFWQQRYEMIRHWEAHLVRSGTQVIKVWLHQSEAEQRRRLLKRLDEPRKRWKFDASDVDTFQERDRYLMAVADAVAHTHTMMAPWYVVPADDKKLARRLVAQLLLSQVHALAPDYPPIDRALDETYRRLLMTKGGNG